MTVSWFSWGFWGYFDDVGSSGCVKIRLSGGSLICFLQFRIVIDNYEWAFSGVYGPQFDKKRQLT